ncbi:MAG TPA: MMPL family transporter [Chitinophagaceae bacterium]|nr:MMPL family transporter [Chitinophagaceae bacterium]
MNENRTRAGVVLLLLITLLSFIPLRSLKFEFNIEKLFPAGDPELTFFKEFQEQFNSQIDDEFIFIGLRNKSGIFDRSFLEKTDSLSKYISRQNNILKIYSLTSANLIYLQGDDINARPLIHIDNPALYSTDSAYLFQAKEYRDLLVSQDGKSIAIAAFNKQNLTDGQKDILLDSIQGKIDQLGFDESHLTAKIRVERVYIKEIQKNLKKYLILAFVFICLALYILFKSIRAIFFPLLLIVVSIIWTFSFISLTGNSIDILSSLLPPILAAICMSDIIHISTHYIELLRTGLSKKEALKKAYKEIGLATFFTCCAIAIGFITLGITDVIPVRNFGFFAATGILMGFGVTMIALYAFFTFSPIPKVTFEKQAGNIWNRILAFFFKTVLKNRMTVSIFFLILTGVSVFYATRIEINSSLLQEIPRKSPVLDDFKFMETDFAGTRPFELALTMRDKGESFFDIEVMQKVEKVERFLKDSCGVGYIISPLSLFRGANKAFAGGDNINYVLPRSQQEVSRYYESILQTEFADEMQHYMTADGSRLRISGRLPNLSIKEFKPIKEKIDRYFAKQSGVAAFSYKITGSAQLLDKITYTLTKNLLSGIFFDALIICVIAFFLLRKWMIVLIVLIPNLLPLIFMAGLMGYMGINLKADTSVIFAIALGLAVDDTIHFISRLRLELSKGLSLPYAVKRTYMSTGKAIIITTLVLLSGFLTLLSSSFGGAFYIGLLISFSLFCAMILELTITPLLVLAFLPKKKR